MRVKVRNLDRYQHYKNKNSPPAWLKLYFTIIDNDYARLSPGAWRLGLEMALLASQTDNGEICADQDQLSWRLRRKIRPADIKALIDAAFLVITDDSRGSLEEVYSKSRGSLEQNRIEEKRIEKKINAVLPHGFAGWWPIYARALKLCNRRVGYKQDALEVWKAKGLEQYADTIQAATLAQIDHYKQAQRAGDKPPAFPDPQRWLSKRRYNDEIPA